MTMICDECNSHYTTTEPCNCTKGENGTCKDCGMKVRWCKCGKKEDTK